MTDADSHGGFLRMLATQARLLLAGNTLHSTILGSCSGGSAASKVVLTPDSGKAPARSSQENSISYTGIFPTTSRLQSRSPHSTSDEDLNAYTAGEELSDKTGGLYFAVTGSTLQGATEAILEETSSTALIKRLKLPAGNHEIPIPVDQSNGSAKFLINIPTGGVGTLAVKDPKGKELKSGMEGIKEIVAGDSRMMIVKPPALKAGVFTASSSSDTEYLLSVSSLSDFGALLAGDTTAGFGKILPIQLSIPGLLSPTELVGPGPDGPGGGTPPAVIPPVPAPFVTSNLRFFVIGEDGSDQGGLALYDDGKHDDKLPGDGVYGGSWLAPKSIGSFRIAVSDGGNYYRVTKLIVTTGAVSVQGPADPVAAPGTTIHHTLTVQNLGSETRSFDLVATTSAGWESIGTLVTPISIDAGAATNVVIPVTVPAAAANGDYSTLTFSAIAQDDPSVKDSITVKTTAWTGPLLQRLEPAAVYKGDELMLYGSGFGSGIGVGDRSTDQNNVTIAGVRLPDANIIEWKNDSIKVRVPGSATSGLVVVTSSGDQSNPLELVVLIPPNQKPIANAGADLDARVGDNVALSGTRSADPDNGPSPLVFHWTQTGGPSVILNSANTASPGFTPTQAGNYIFQLMVNDGKDDSAPDSVTVAVSMGLATANAGSDLTVKLGTKVILDGRASVGPGGRESKPLTFHWRQTGGPSAILDGNATATISFVPEVPGIYAFELSVSDGLAPSLTDSVSVTVEDVPVCLLTPNGGETWKAKSAQPIRWYVSSNLANKSKPLKIQLSKNGGKKWKLLKKANAHAGLLQWKPQRANASVTARIRVCAASVNKKAAPICDSSDGDFSILRK